MLVESTDLSKFKERRWILPLPKIRIIVFYTYLIQAFKMGGGMIKCGFELHFKPLDNKVCIIW